MMMSGIRWSPSEAATVNEFLNSPVGRKWLQELAKRKPKIDIVNNDRAALTGAFAAGYDQVFAEIAATRAAPEPDTSSSKGIDPTKD